MKYFLKTIIMLFFIVTVVTYKDIQGLEVILFLLFLCADIYRNKYKNTWKILIVEIIFIFILYFYNNKAFILFGILLLDTIACYNKYLVFFIYMAGVYASFNLEHIIDMANYLFYITVCTSLGLLMGKLEEVTRRYNSIYDKERKYIYELEATKEKLINSSKEIVYLTEVKERNRIAREIHDSIGHSLAGILMQLQAARRVLIKDKEKARDLMDNSIENLSNSLTLIRDTVYNIKPKENLGVEYVENIINNYKFCKVDFEFSGDFNTLASNEMRIIIANIKEALTNSSKYSNAENIFIRIDINENFTRLYIKDDGVGCPNIKEGLGISGMKERIRNIGGSISISTEEGFLIVCIIPRNERGTSVFENINS